MEENGKRKKRILIFEGVATSGKTTLEKLVAGRLPGSFIVRENETLMPLIDNRDPEVALSHLQNLVKSMDANPAPVLIVDRFHLTHAFRTHADLKEFSPIEEDLRKMADVTLILLEVDEAAIKERINESTLRRQGAWLKGKQGSIEERTDYYVKQQDELLELSSSSKLPRNIINTTEKDWAKYADEIVNVISEQATPNIRG